MGARKHAKSMRKQQQMSCLTIDEDRASQIEWFPPLSGQMDDIPSNLQQIAFESGQILEL